MHTVLKAAAVLLMVMSLGTAPAIGCEREYIKISGTIFGIQGGLEAENRWQFWVLEDSPIAREGCLIVSVEGPGRIPANCVNGAEVKAEGNVHARFPGKPGERDTFGLAASQISCGKLRYKY